MNDMSVTPVSAPVRTPALVAAASNSIARLTATEFLDLLRRDDITILEYAQACADVIASLEDDINAWIWYRREDFEAVAKAADEALRKYRRAGGAPGTLPGQLTGVPIGVKDIYNTADMPTCHGSTIFADYRPGNDARVVTNLRREGGIMAGKTVTAEFAVHEPGKTRNPHDLRRSCGTSSSGSAAAVATAMVPVSLASQTAGSTIRPASYCGVHGFKPSYGLFPRTAMLKTTDTLDTVGFMARSVTDLRLLFEIMRVRGWNYPIVDAALNDPARRSIGNGPWRVGVLEGPKSHLESAAVKDGVRRIARRLADLGCEVVAMKMPVEFNAAHDVHETIYRRSLAYYFRMEWAAHADRFSAQLAAMLGGGEKITPEEYYNALAAQSAYAKQFDEWMKQVDVAICPSTADEAPIGLETPDIPDHCLLFTLCYAPSMSLPLLSGTTGLPVGLQVATRRFNDYILMDFADYLASGVR